MLVRRVIIALVLFLVFLVGLFFFLRADTEYFRFQHKSDRYYAEFAKACDTVLQHNPLGTNQFIELSAADSSLPKVIRDLPPLKIKASRQRVWILHDGSIEFGITWERDDSRANIWTLSTACESDVRVVYTAKR
jgi:hypothetical protein